MARKIEIETLRTIDGDDVVHTVCNDGRTCVGLHALADRPGRDYYVLKRVDDPAEMAALAPLAAADEVIGWAPSRLRTGEP